MGRALIERAISDGDDNHFSIVRSDVRHGHAAGDGNSCSDDGILADEAPVGRHHVSRPAAAAIYADAALANLSEDLG